MFIHSTKPTLLRPYTGARVREHQAYRSCNWYGKDNPANYKKYMQKFAEGVADPEHRVDDDWFYQFNSCGFRGEDYDPNADFRLVTIGCSYTFGTGVKWRQSWSYHFKKSLEEKLKHSVNLVNFSQGGASNDYICRMLLSQCEVMTPDLVLVQFAHPSRTEWFDDESHLNIGPWAAEKDDTAQTYYEYFTDELGILNLLKNALLIQQYLKEKSIDYRFSIRDFRRFFSNAEKRNSALNAFLDLIDFEKVTTLHPQDADIKSDFARDCGHPGPKSHLEFSKRLFAWYSSK